SPLSLPTPSRGASKAEEIAEGHTTTDSTSPADQPLLPDEALVKLTDADGRTYFWDRRSKVCSWVLPKGVDALWAGRKCSDGRTYYWKRTGGDIDSKKAVWVLPSLTSEKSEKAPAEAKPQEAPRQRMPLPLRKDMVASPAALSCQLPQRGAEAEDLGPFASVLREYEVKKETFAVEVARPKVRVSAQAPPAAEVKTEESPTVVKDLSAKLVEVTADSAQLREELAVLKREMAEFAAARHVVEKRGKRLERSRSTSRSRRSRKNKSKKSKPSYDSSPSASRSPGESRSRGSRRTPAPAARSSRSRSRGRSTSSHRSSVAPPSCSLDRRSRSSRNRVSRRSCPGHSRSRGSERSISRHKSVVAASCSPDRSVSRRSCSRRVSRHGSAARSRNLSKRSISSRKSSPAGASRSPARSASKQSRLSRRSSAGRSRSPRSAKRVVVPSRQASPASSSHSPSPRVSRSSCPSRSLAAIPQKQQQSVFELWANEPSTGSVPKPQVIIQSVDSRLRSPAPVFRNLSRSRSPVRGGTPGPESENMLDRFMTSVVHGKPPGSWAPGASPQVDGVGTRLAVTEWCPSGEKPVSATYVFFHATGFHSRCWDEVIKRLDADAHCFAIDARGHGQSDKPPPRDGVYLWPELADEAASVLRTLGVKDALGIGHSMGGYLLLHAALSDKSFFSGLLLLDPVVAPAAHYAAWCCKLAHKLCREEVGETTVPRRPLEARAGDQQAAPVPVVILRAEFGLETISLGSKDIFNASPTDPDLWRLFPRAKDVHLKHGMTHFIPMQDPGLIVKYLGDLIGEVSLKTPQSTTVTHGHSRL
ncbi:unnamed protein product, partial [Polarella glacialis]